MLDKKGSNVPATPDEIRFHIDKAHGWTPIKQNTFRYNGMDKMTPAQQHEWLHEFQVPLNMIVPHGSLDHD